MMQCKYLDVDEKPVMPLLAQLPDGRLGEADSIPGAAALLLGLDYIDVDDERTAWHMRVQYLRAQALVLAMEGKKAMVRDDANIIFDNTATPTEEGEEEVPEDWFNDVPPVTLWASDDRVFLLSLHEAGVITLYEREDSHAFRLHPAWEEIGQSGGESQQCGLCRQYDSKELFCSPYRLEGRESGEGRRCAAFAPVTEGFLGVSPGKSKRIRIRYINLREEKIVEQWWVCKRLI
ncbi:MAG TPA: hypothetical protein DEF36_13740 [Desulfotomaculum sp.]|nr:hypothetical protein [Desulfotomaculum sp.]